MLKVLRNSGAIGDKGYGRGKYIENTGKIEVSGSESSGGKTWDVSGFLVVCKKLRSIVPEDDDVQPHAKVGMLAGGLHCRAQQYNARKLV